MADGLLIGEWNRHKFEISPKVFRSFSGLQIDAEAETEDKIVDSAKLKYVSRKNSKPATVQLTVILNRHAGCMVYTEVTKFIEDAQAGATGYFYIGKRKLVPYELMLTKATAKEVCISPKGTWVSAEVQLSLKQADSTDPGHSVKSESSGSGGSGGGGGSSGGGGGG